MIREISGRGLVPKKAAAAAEKVKEAQEIMIQIVEAYKKQNNGDALPLLSPGLPDNKWGDNTDASYKSILKKFNKDNPAPADIDAAILALNKILTSLNVSAAADAADAAKAAPPSAAPAKPVTPEKADDAKAKAGFKNLLDLLQSKRLNLSAGGNKDEFKQRIERDWMAIIRAYGSTGSVVETFYPHLSLTDPEKILLAAVDAKTAFSTNYSSVLAKINNKFLETISKYIKPIGRAFRTERGMARVIDRRQKREEKRSNSLERLNILSKVAARKDIARERLEKTALVPLIVPPAVTATAWIGLSLYGGYGAASYAINKINEYLNKDFVSKEEFEETIGDEKFKKIMGISLADWVDVNDKTNITIFSVGNHYNYKPATNAYASKLKSMRNAEEEAGRKILAQDVVEEISPTQDTKKQSPPQTRRAPTKDPTARMRTLFQSMNLPVDNATGWTETINNSFKDAYDAWKAIPGNENKPDISNGWRQIAPQIGFSNDISGATDLVEVLYIKNRKDYTGTQQAQTPPPPVAADAESAYNDTNRAKTKLTELFEKILSGSTKVDRVGIDLRNDTKIFKGVIRGLGGVMEAVEYVFSEVKFTPGQLAELTRMNFDSNQKIAINALSPVRNLFVNIRKVSTDGIGRDRRGLTEDSLARSVTRWLGEQTATPPAKTSIRKSIEIRKMAARKKLGF